MPRPKPFFSLAFALAVLTACDDGSSRLAGRYAGNATASSGAEQVVVDVADWKPVSETSPPRRELVIEISRILASATPRTLRLVSEGEGDFPDQVTLSGEGIDGAVALAREDRCYAGSGYRFCFDSPKISLTEPTEKVDAESGLRLPAPANHPRWNLDELVGRARFLGFSTREEAEKLFQARQQMAAAEGNLLPHLSVGEILSIALGGGVNSLIEDVSDLLPFIFPSNWFKRDEAEDLLKAQTFSFAAIRADAMSETEGLTHALSRDFEALQLTRNHLEWLTQLMSAMEIEAKAGALPPGTLSSVAEAIRRVQSDSLVLKDLIGQESAALSQAVSLDPVAGITELEPPAEISDSDAVPMKADGFVQRARDVSLELATLRALVDASRNHADAAAWSLVDPGSYLAIGFGTGAELEVANSGTRQIEVKLDETTSTIGQNSTVLASQFNAALSQLSIAEGGVTATRQRITKLLRRYMIGDIEENEFASGVIELGETLLSYSALRASSRAALRIGRAKLDRLLLRGWYSRPAEGK